MQALIAALAGVRMSAAAGEVPSEANILVAGRLHVVVAELGRDTRSLPFSGARRLALLASVLALAVAFPLAVAGIVAVALQLIELRRLDLQAILQPLDF